MTAVFASGRSLLARDAGLYPDLTTKGPKEHEESP